MQHNREVDIWDLELHPFHSEEISIQDCSHHYLLASVLLHVTMVTQGLHCTYLIKIQDSAHHYEP